jgi:hypothetical protein
MPPSKVAPLFLGHTKVRAYFAGFSASGLILILAIILLLLSDLTGGTEGE